MKRLFSLTLMLLFVVSLSAQNTGKLHLKSLKTSNGNQSTVLQETANDQIQRIYQFTGGDSHKSQYAGKGTVFSDDFEAGNLNNFTVINHGDLNTFMWSSTGGHYAPGCAFIEYSPDAHDDWLITPALACQNGSYIKFWYKHESNTFPEIFDVMLSTTGTNPSDFTDTLASAVNPSESYQQAIFDLSAYAGQTVYVGIHTTTQYQWILYLDEFEFGYPDPHDLAVTAIYPVEAHTLGNITPQVKITNLGTSTETVFDVTLSDGVSYNQTISNPGTIAPDSSLVVNMPTWTPTPAAYTLTATVTVAGDANTTNNTKTQTVYIYEADSIIYAQHWFVNKPGQHTSGADLSMLEASQTTLGYNFNHADGYKIADDFVVPDGKKWTVTGFNIYGYQTGSDTLSTFTGGYFEIYDGDPSNGGQLITNFNDTNLMVATFWTNAYRVSNGDFTGSTSPIMQVVNACPTSVVLMPGNYWLVWSATGSLSSGPWCPHLQDTSGNTTTGNAIQWDGTAWSPLSDGGPQGMPFDVLGTVENLGAFYNFHVTNGTNNIENANVIINNDTITTAANGLTPQIFLAPGTYNYTVEKFGFQQFSDSVTVVDGVNDTVEVTLTAIDYDVTFNIKNILDTPLNAEVTIFSNGNNVVSNGTATNGTITFTVPVGSYTFNIEYNGYQSIVGDSLEVVDQNVIIDATLLEIKNPPVGLVANGTVITWSEPITPKWIHYDNDTNYTSIGTKGFIGKYNVYLDDTLKTLTPITDTTYDFGSLPTGSHVAGVTALYATGESDTAKVTITITVINENNIKVTLSPNPTNGILNINADAIYNISIVDITGKQVASQPMTSKNATMDLRNLENGVYFLRLSNEQASKVVKIVKQ